MSNFYINLSAVGFRTWKESVSDETQLPLSGNDLGDARVVIDSDSIFVWDGLDWEEISGGGGGGGVSTASNVGTGTGLPFKQLTGADLEFRSLKAGANVSIANNTNDVTFSLSGVTSFGILQTDTGTAPTAASIGDTLTLTSTDLGIAGNSGTDTVTFSLNTVTAAKGGTGQTSYTGGDLLYASGASALSKLGIGTASYLLSSSGSAPQWGLLVNANVDANAAIAASKLAAITASRVMVSNGSGFYSASSVTTTTLGFLDATSSIQTQLNGKLSTAGGTLTDSLAFSGNRWIGSSGSNTFGIRTNSTERILLDTSGNVIINTAALATNATNGFLYIPTCAGTPTGTPTSYTGRAPIITDTTNSILYVYVGGAWKGAALV